MATLYRGRSEDYSVVNPVELGYSEVFNFFNKIFNPNGGGMIKNTFDLKYGFPPVLKLWRWIRIESPDVFVIKNIESTFSILAFLFSIFFAKKAIFIMQLPKYRKSPKSGSVFLANLFGARVITPVLGNVEFKNDNPNLFYLPFPIESRDYEKKYFKDDRLNIVCVGKFQERKDQMLLVRAVEKLIKKYPISLTLVGQDDEEEYKGKLIDYIQNQDLSGDVIIMEHREWAETLRLYENFDLFVLPSYLESASYSVLEAMSKKLAVICSDDNGTATYIEEGVNGYVFKHKNLESLVEKIEKCIKDRNVLMEMGQKSFEIASKHHSPQVFYDKFMEVVTYKS
jgi:glycosyltransferase involved in cell wall biosynthesis